VVLGKINECWICDDPRDNKKKLCTIYIVPKGMLLSGFKVWLCKICKKNMRCDA